ncbi:hypothetical protein [Lysinibacter cavernae]|uniref:hypothetical protein n=1 Tax=Lysinibacter cavernae TaxID=1640652 RepID=UPI003608C4FE
MTLEIVRLVLVFAHFIGLSAIIGAFILQLPWKSGFDFFPVCIGAGVQLLTGFGLVAVNEIADDVVNPWKVGTKLAITCTVLIVGLIGARRARLAKHTDSDVASLKPLILLAGITAMVNVGLAVFWR